MTGSGKRRWPCSIPRGRSLAILRAIFARDAAFDGRWAACRDFPWEALPGPALRLLPLLHERLEERGRADELPEKLRALRRYHWCRNRRLLLGLPSLWDALSAKGIEALLLGGSALALYAYRGPELRPLPQLQLLVKEPDLAEALRCLSLEGWTALSPLPPLPPLPFPARRRQTFAREEGERLLLSWRPLTTRLGEAASEAFWEQSQPLNWEGASFRRPSDGALLWQLLMEACTEGPVPDAIWLADALTLLSASRDDFDWDAFEGMCSWGDGRLVLRDCLALLEQSFAVTPPPALIEGLGEAPSKAERVEYEAALRCPADRNLLFRLRHHWQRHHGTSFLTYLCRLWEVRRPWTLPFIALRRLLPRVLGW